MTQLFRNAKLIFQTIFSACLRHSPQILQLNIGIKIFGKLKQIRGVAGNLLS